MEHFGALDAAVADTGFTSSDHRRTAGATVADGGPWAVTGLAENLRPHATTRGVGVTLVKPGTTGTPLWPDGSAPPFALPAEPVADAVAFARGQPPGVGLDTLTVRPIGQPV